ncbi:MAG: pyrimidine monooxygenase RutA [Rhodospirillaceae bacterium]|nr:pyrimidine monooxygenase RutA [Rhodospirillaceae bacterium]
MKYGVFLPNGSNGYVLSEALKPYLPTYEHQRKITIEAEKQGLSFALPMIKFRGFGGATGYWDHCLEPFTLIGALAAETQKLTFVPTVALLALHPVYTARLVSTLANISKGRIGLNIVTGWNQAEYSQMGLWPGKGYYESRYEYAEEYLAILNDLWSTGRCSRKSIYWDLKDCQCFPLPQYKIPIFSAGQSPAGIDFCEKHVDQRFVFGQPHMLRKLEIEHNKRKKKTYGTYLLFHMIVSDTDTKAKAIGEEIISKADKVAIANQISSASLDTSIGGTSEAHRLSLDKSLEDGNAAFNTIPVIYGSPKTVASKIEEIGGQTGADGFMFSWNNFEEGIRVFGQEILPRISKRN